MNRHVYRWMLAGVLVAVQSAASAAVYHYVDESGRKIFVDRKSQVPERYRDQLQVRARSASPSSRVLSKQPEDEGELTPQQQRDKLQAYLRKLETPVKILNNSVMVPVTLTYAGRSLTLELVLDTGASRTLVYDDAIALFNQIKRPAGRVQVADGAVLDTHQVNFRYLKVGPHTLDSPSLTVMAHKGSRRHDGLLGMDFLRQVKYEIDFDRSLLIWEPEYYQQAQDNLAQLERSMQEGANPGS